MAKCNCLTLPFQPDPPCFNECIHKTLIKISLQQKQEILGLSYSTAQSIFDAYNRFDVQSFDDLRNYLNGSQIEEIINSFRRLTQQQLNMLNNTDENLGGLLNA